MRDNIYYITKSGETIIDNDSSFNSIGHASLPDFLNQGKLLPQKIISLVTYLRENESPSLLFCTKESRCLLSSQRTKSVLT